MQVYDGGKVIVYELRSGYNGVSLAVRNFHDVSLEVTMDCKAVNALSHTGNLKATQACMPRHVGSRVVMCAAGDPPGPRGGAAPSDAHQGGPLVLGLRAGVEAHGRHPRDQAVATAMLLL